MARTKQPYKPPSRIEHCPAPLISGLQPPALLTDNANLSESVRATNKALAQYKIALDFLPESQAARISQPGSQAAHADLMRERNEVEKLQLEAERSIYMMRPQIVLTRNAVIMDAASRDQYWYRKSDIMTLDSESIRLVFEEHPVQDAAQFQDYLRNTLPTHLRKPIDVQGAVENETTVERRSIRAESFRKVFLLLKILLDSSDPHATRHGISFSVFMVSTILPRGCWDIVRYPSSHIGGTGHLQWDESLPQNCRNLINFMDNILTPPESDWESWWAVPHGTFLDAAAMYRDLYSAYASHLCRYSHRGGYASEYEEYHLFDQDSSKCFHAHAIRLVRALYRLAHKEIRERVLLAVGSHLPVELADIVVDKALQAEDIPTAKDIIQLVNYDWEDGGIAETLAELDPPYHALNARCDDSFLIQEYSGQRSLNTVLCYGD